MIEGHIIFNAIIYSIVIAYILYINFSAYYQTGTGFLKALVNLFQNWIFRTVYLLIVGFFALDIFPYGGFVLAILLTIAFLNTNMLVYKKDVEESLTMREEQDEEKKLPVDVPIQQQQQQQQMQQQPQQMNNQLINSSTPTYPSPESLGIQSNPSMMQPPPPPQTQNTNQQPMMMNQQPMMMNQQPTQMMNQQPTQMMNQQGTMTNQQAPMFVEQNPPSLPYQQPMMDQSQ